MLVPRHLNPSRRRRSWSLVRQNSRLVVGLGNGEYSSHWLLILCDAELSCEIRSPRRHCPSATRGMAGSFGIEWRSEAILWRATMYHVLQAGGAGWLEEGNEKENNKKVRRGLDLVTQLRLDICVMLKKSLLMFMLGWDIQRQSETNSRAAHGNINVNLKQWYRKGRHKLIYIYTYSEALISVLFIQRHLTRVSRVLQEDAAA